MIEYNAIQTLISFIQHQWSLRSTWLTVLLRNTILFSFWEKLSDIGVPAVYTLIKDFWLVHLNKKKKIICNYFPFTMDFPSSGTRFDSCNTDNILHIQEELRHVLSFHSDRPSGFQGGTSALWKPPLNTWVFLDECFFSVSISIFFFNPSPSTINFLP